MTDHDVAGLIARLKTHAGHLPCVHEAAAALEAMRAERDEALQIRNDFASRNAELWARAEQAERDLEVARRELAVRGVPRK